MSTAEGGGGGQTVPNDIDSPDNAVVEATVETAVDLIGEATSELDLQIGPVLEKNGEVYDPAILAKLSRQRHCEYLSPRNVHLGSALRIGTDTLNQALIGAVGRTAKDQVQHQN